MKRCDLEILLNEKTGSAFHILAKNPQYLCAIRFFFEPTEGGMLSFGFRIRVQKGEGFTSSAPSFKMALMKDFPNVSWTKISTSYASILGRFILPCSAGDFAQIIELYKENKMAQICHAVLEGSLGEFQFYFSEAAFVELVDDYFYSLVGDLHKINPQLLPNQIAVDIPGPFPMVWYSKGVPVQVQEVPEEEDTPPLEVGTEATPIFLQGEPTDPQGVGATSGEETSQAL